jgi:predicted nucleotidyltransferase
MSVSQYFKEFCDNLRMSNDTISKIQYRYQQITKRINLDYYISSSSTAHSLYVGSYGRDTEIFTSDIDVIVQLPYSTYEKFNNYSGNGQSALLQEVKSVLNKTYSTSNSKGDGQVIAIKFTDGIDFEILPAFVCEDNSFIHANANSGGSWANTNPRKEIEAIRARNVEVNYNLKRLCRMIRAWKVKCNVPLNGILIDTLAYKFIGNWQYKGESYLYYDFMSRDFFKYLMDIPASQSFWFKPGSGTMILKSGDFQYKAKQAYNKSIEAIKSESDGYHNTSKMKWREIYGTKFPS